MCERVHIVIARKVNYDGLTLSEREELSWPLIKHSSGTFAAGGKGPCPATNTPVLVLYTYG